jgi:hypothetical protein
MCLWGKNYRIHVYLIKRVYGVCLFCLIISDILTLPAVTTLHLHRKSHILFVCSRLSFPVPNSTISIVPTACRLILPPLIAICLRKIRLIHPHSHPHNTCIPSGAAAMRGVVSQLLYVIRGFRSQQSLPR